MSVKTSFAAILACAAIAGCSPAAPVKARISTLEPIKQACAGRDGWSDAATPAHIYANVYMVGTCGITSLLITTPEGHFLIDGATAESAAGIAANIRKLGFEPKDVRYILASHEHIDHAGGLAELKRITGAKFVTRMEAKGAMESGKPGPTDPQLGSLPPFEGLKADLVLRDGDKLNLGKQMLTMIATPGHTPGGTSWTWKSCERAKCLQIVFSDSLNAVSADTYRFTDHPTYVATLRNSITLISSLENCDILISPHPGQSELFDRLSDRSRLVDRTGCARYAKAAEDRLEARMAKEALN